MNFSATLRTVLFLLVPVSALATNQYDIHLNLDAANRMMHATSIVTFRAPHDGTSFRFLLNKSLNVTKVECLQCRDFHFAKELPSDYRYIPDGAPLQVNLRRAVKAGDELRVTIGYEGTLAELAWGVNMLTPGYTELAQYIGWYPFMPELKTFRYAVKASLPETYELSGAGEIKKLAPGRWRVVQQSDTFDIVLAAAPTLKRVAVRGGAIEVVYLPSIDEEQVNSLVQQIDATLANYKRWFGPERGGRLTVLLNQRESGGSYVRPGFVSIAYSAGADQKTKRRMAGSVAHELSHLWWTGAPTTTWEDWLNESFAQYSSWLMLKKLFGQEEFDAQLQSAQERTKGAPAIWGIDRSDEKAYLVLYDKGALLLHQLETDIGQEKFLALTKEVSQTSHRNTGEFLSRLERITSGEVRSKFEAGLKN